jgi:hypothetical protein
MLQFLLQDIGTYTDIYTKELRTDTAHLETEKKHEGSWINHDTLKEVGMTD